MSFFVSFHDFHVTHTTIHYNASNEKIEITIKLAIEDLERALEDQGIKDLRIGSDIENERLDQLIKDYFSQRLKIYPNNRPTLYEWVGKELSTDLHNLYLYFEIVNCNQKGEIKSVFVENTIFTDLLRDQANIVLIEFGENKHNLTFSKMQKSQNVTLN
tara:strand:- start:252 stop:728 length:477 start_codon:yes stop_codon:yes gene_type:complete